MPLLRALVALADERHFGRAAQRLHLSQPALSRQIARLEGEVGTTLFRRSTRGVTPTPSGDRLARRAAEALRAIDLAVDEARAGDGLSEPVRLGAAETIGDAFLAEVTGALRAPRAPQLTVHVGWGAELLGSLRRGALDLVVGHALALPDGLEHEVLALEPLCAHVAAREDAAGRPATALREFAGWTLVLPPRELAPGRRSHVTACCRAAGFDPRTRVPPLIAPPAAGGIGTALEEREFALAPASLPPRAGAAAVALSEGPLVPLLVAHGRGVQRTPVAAVLDVLRQAASPSAAPTVVQTGPGLEPRLAAPTAP